MIYCYRLSTTLKPTRHHLVLIFDMGPSNVRMCGTWKTRTQQFSLKSHTNIGKIISRLMFWYIKCSWFFCVHWLGRNLYNKSCAIRLGIRGGDSADNTHFTIILPSKYRSSKWYLSCRVPDQNSLRTSSLPHKFSVSQFDHIDTTRWATKFKETPHYGICCSILVLPLPIAH
jgi:hypothetical protein